MALESATFVSGFVSTNPVTGDQVSQGDDHVRLIKAVLLATFPNAAKAFYFPDHASKTSNYSVLAGDQNKIFSGDATGGAVNFTLPVVGISAGYSVVIVKSDISANAVTLTPSTGTISGAANISLASQWAGAIAIWTGSTWIGLRFFTETLTGDITFSGEVTFEDVVTFEQGIEFDGPLQVDGTAEFNDQVQLDAEVKLGVDTISDAASVAISFAEEPYKKWTMAGNRTWAAPTGESEGMLAFINSKQDAGGARVPTFNAAFKFSGGVVVRPDPAADAETFYMMFARGADDILMIPLWATNLGHIGFYKDFTITSLQANTRHTATHNLGRVPSAIQVMLLATGTDAGYSAGDYIMIPLAGNRDGGGGGQTVGASAGMNTTEAWLTVDDDIDVKHKTTGTQTSLNFSDWDVVIRVFS